MAFSLDSKVKDILKNPEASAVQSAFLKPHLEELEKELQAIE